MKVWYMLPPIDELEFMSSAAGPDQVIVRLNRDHITKISEWFSNRNLNVMHFRPTFKKSKDYLQGLRMCAIELDLPDDLEILFKLSFNGNIK